jgi:hypothetical protein
MNNIKGQKLTKPTKVQGLLSNQSIVSIEQTYPLTELDFELMQNGKSQTYNIAITMLLTALGYSLGLLEQFFDKKAQISIAEWDVLGVVVFLSIIVYLIGYIIPNKRKKTIQKIKQHFESIPKGQYFMENNSNESE